MYYSCYEPHDDTTRVYYIVVKNRSEKMAEDTTVSAIYESLRKLNQRPYAPQITIVSSDIPVSKKNLRLVVDDTPLREFGIPPLPLKMDDSVYLDTVGVPVEWRDQVMEALSKQNSRVDTSTQLTMKRFIISTRLDWRTVHLILYLVRTRKTTECYLTQGSLSKIDESLKPGENCKWLIHFRYEKILRSIAACTSDGYKAIHELDQSFRFKRAKRDPFNTVTTIPEGRSFCYLAFINDGGRVQSQWVDISLSNDAPQSSHAEPKPAYAGPRCNIKGCSVMTNLLVCSRCKNVHYCGVEHQKADWSLHKKECVGAK